MKIETERLILRDFKEKDLKSVVEGLNNINVSRFMSRIPYPYKISEAHNWFLKYKKAIKGKNRNKYEFGIELAEEKKLVGCISLGNISTFNASAEVGYWLNERYHHRGLMSECLQEVLKFCFKKLKLRRVEAFVGEHNIASANLLLKMGFVKEGLLRKARKMMSTGEIHNYFIFSLLKEDWEKTKYAKQ